MSQIKELQPKEGVTLLAYLLPENADKDSLKVTDWGTLYYYTGISPNHCGEEMPLPCKCKLLGTIDQIPEEVWQGIVESEDGKHHGVYGKCYKDYGDQKRFAPHFNNATSSAMSFLEAHCIDPKSIILMKQND